MLTRSRSYYLMRLERLRRIRRVRNLATLGLVVLGPVLALVTYLVLGPLEQGGNTPSLRIILLIDLVYILLVAALVLSEVARLVGAARDAGLDVCLGGEDASRADLEFIVRVAEVAQAAGARRLRFADTVGVMEPFAMHERFRFLAERLDLELEVHAHDDFGLATANTLAAVRGGATHISEFLVSTRKLAPPTPFCPTSIYSGVPGTALRRARAEGGVG